MTAPLEKIKLDAQTTGSRNSLVSELRNTYRTLGVRGLYAGNFANCCRVFPYAGIVTYCYLTGLKYMPTISNGDPMEPVYRGSVAALSGMTGQLVTYPIDAVRLRLTVAPERYHGILNCGLTIVREEGIRALYKGLNPTLFCVVPFLACQMITADTLKARCAINDIEVTPLRMLVIGGTAGLLAQTMVYPMDVLRRRMQAGVQTPHNSSSSKAALSEHTTVALRQIFQREGVRSLFAGIIPSYMKIFPAVAIAMTTTKTLIGVSLNYKKHGWNRA
uniref:Mitochondrial carrier protein n=2 Tax=Octactis speculum TaxID=3111310 RepID=A0A7S2GNB2_9STRA|mmetsp:Transcript_52798/g.72064  ORF Transcript_52798/g.72064 Transcript_52798/m.72064 type:complete len:275 (+) Transcript_52798:226-1050(+)